MSQIPAWTSSEKSKEGLEHPSWEKAETLLFYTHARCVSSYSHCRDHLMRINLREERFILARGLGRYSIPGQRKFGNRKFHNGRSVQPDSSLPHVVIKQEAGNKQEVELRFSDLRTAHRLPISSREASPPKGCASLQTSIAIQGPGVHTHKPMGAFHSQVGHSDAAVLMSL